MRNLAVDDIAAFVRELLSPERARPVIALSTIPHTTRTWHDADALEAALPGTSVVRIETGDPSWELSRLLPPRLDVYGGAVRIWWPGLRADSDPYTHPLFIVHSAPHALAVQARLQELVRAAAGAAGADVEVWQRAASGLAPGDVLEGRVVAVRDFGAFVELRPGVTGLVHKSKIDWRYVEDPGDYLERGEMVRVKILSIAPAERRIELSIKDAFSGALLAAPPAVREGWKAAGPSAAEVAELKDRLERVSEEAEAAAADRADLRQQLGEAKRALRSERDAHAALRRRVAGELDPLSSERAFLLAVRLCYARMLDESDRGTHPLRRMRAGRRFLESARALEGLDLEKLLEVCTQVACDLARDLPARELHQLRAGERGASSRRRASDGAIAWRCSLQDNTPSARRLHYWSVPGPDGGWIEFALACVHDEFEIPE